MVHVSKLLKKFKKREDGQAMTEFALVAPVLIMLAMGILFLGYFVYSHIIVVSAANQGARAGSALSADPDVAPYEVATTARTTAESTLSNGLNISYGQVDVQMGRDVSVSVNYEFQFAISLPGFPSSHTITHTSSYMAWGDG